MSPTKKTSPEGVRIVGRDDELTAIRACIKAGRNILLEGPVGVGKTQLALAVTRELKRPVFRIDGDSRYSEQKLAGWFDPPLTLQKGFTAEAFMPGPLVQAMQQGGVLFINELNRLPEGVQNILLPAIDERFLILPRLGEVRAKDGFVVIATQNPKEFVATTHLSEAILDRFEWVVVGYQPEDEEQQIVREQAAELSSIPKPDGERIVTASIRLVRATRSHPRIRRGASIRAALSLADLCAAFIHSGLELQAAFIRAALMALPTRIELERDVESEQDPQKQMEQLLKELARDALGGNGNSGSKKKT
jgi:MoxR-like ATPase